MDKVGMRATAPYLKLTQLSPFYEEIPAKVLRDPVKIYGKGAGSQLPVFTKIYSVCYV